MTKPVVPTRTKHKVADVPADAALSWREFFVGLGDGTLLDEAARRESRDGPDQRRPSRKRPAETAPR